MMPNEFENAKAYEERLLQKFKQKIEIKQRYDEKTIFTPSQGMQVQQTRRPEQPVVFQRQRSFGTDSSMQPSRQASLRDEPIEVDTQPVYTLPRYINQQQTQLVRQSEDIIQIEVSIPMHGGYDKKTEVVRIHKSRDMADLYARVRRVIRDNGRWTPDIKDVKILFKNSIVSESISL